MTTRAEVKEIVRDAVIEHIKRKGIPKSFDELDLDAFDADSDEAKIAKEIFDGGFEPTIEVWFEDDENELLPGPTKGRVW